ncbi:hypothetical protein TU94_29845 [Streptomyces cyaneogriseus subsp. noncyanogenus]|uniref:Uncharacterized protein n=2 Tax=Streptomyces cyaneogriseus TaxID=68192 RepID=A0A0C5G8E9_9ACTN|nr:hypothetical protein TU94_29845 [Streptomyces cyaneogriseus subsp. noncyanogenus]
MEIPPSARGIPVSLNDPLRRPRRLAALGGVLMPRLEHRLPQERRTPEHGGSTQDAVPERVE